MEFHDEINTGTTAGDGQGAGLRTNLRKLHENTKYLKEQFLEGGSSGSITYQTLAALNAVSPVPPEGTSATVANDTNPDNNGDYAVSNGVWVKNAETSLSSINLITKLAGLSIDIKEFKLNINGADINFPQTTLTLPQNETSYLGYDLVDYSLHFLRRDYQDGIIWVGKVTTDTTDVVNIQQITPKLPIETIGNFKEKLINGIKGVNVAVISDSLGTATGSETTTSFPEMLFDSSKASFGINVPSVVSVNLTNFSVGGQTSHYGALWAGKASRSGTGNYNNTAISSDNLAQSNVFPFSSFKVLKNSPLFTRDYDLVIIGFGANGGSNKFAWLENTVKNLRNKGIDVIIYTQNSRAGGGVTNNTAYYDDGSIFKHLKDSYGCGLADSWCNVMELALSGEDTHHDDVHLKDVGKVGTGLSVRTIINDKTLPKGNSPISSIRSIKEPTNAYLNKNFPNTVEVDCHPATNEGTMVASLASNEINPAVQYCGLDASASVIQLAVGETVRFNHAYANAFDIIYDASMIGEVDITKQSGNTLVTTLSNTVFSGNLPKLKEGSQSLGAGNLMANTAVQITCTSGTAKIYGILWHVYKNRTINLENLNTNGAWQEEAWHYGQPKHLYTDTIGDSVSFKYFGSGATIFLNKRSAAGIVDVYLNGELIIADEDLYSTGSFTSPIYIAEAANEYYDVPPVENTVTIHLKGANASAISPTSTNRRLGVVMVKEFDRR